MSVQHVTARDREICLMLHEHRVLTTEHLTDLYFDSERRARRRLQVLLGRKLVDRFRPHRIRGSYPWHWILGELGASVVAAERGVELKTLRWRRDRLAAYAFSPHLPHLLQTNSVFSKLHRACRDRCDLHLSDWWPETRCAQAWEGLVRPDGLGILDSLRDRARFAVELDRGTENGARLEDKLLRYQRIAPLPGAPRLIGFVFGSERREAEARKWLRNAATRVATATFAAATADPLGAVWLAIGGQRRMTIEHLLFGDTHE